MRKTLIAIMTVLGAISGEVLNAGAKKSQVAPPWPEDHKVRLSWDASTFSELREVYVENLDYIEHNLYYPRAKHLGDGSVLLSFSNHHYGYDIYAVRSEDCARTWSNAVCIAHSYDTVYTDSKGLTEKDRIVYVNPDFIELQDGRVIMAYQWRYLHGYNDLPKTNENCGIMVAFSSDKGRTWTGHKEVYRGRCWEPAFLQLPSGEIQMYITSSQEIRQNTSCPRTVIIRSFDGGVTWQGKECCGIDDNEAVSRTVDERFAYDGMPSAVLLDDNKGIVMPLEVWSGPYVMDQTPVVVKTTMEENWKLDQQRILAEGGPDYPMKKEVNKNFQGYGPYCTKLPTGEVIVQSNGTYKGVQGMWAFVGDKSADRFHFATSPFVSDEYWGSVDCLENSSVLSAGTYKYKGYNDETFGMVRLITARLNRELEISEGSLEMPSVQSFDRSTENGWWFLGKKFDSQLFVNFGYTAGNFEIGAYLYDKVLTAFTPENSDAPFITFARSNGDVYGLAVNALGKYVVYKEVDWSWLVIDSGTTPDLEVVGTVNNDKDTDTGYSVKVSIPWDKIGGKPAKGEALKAHIGRYFKTESKEKPLSCYEELEGENSDYPSEWLGIILKGRK